MCPEYLSNLAKSPYFTLNLTTSSRPWMRWLALGEWSHHYDYLGLEDFFLYSSSVYSCHLFLISSASVRSIPFLSFIEPIFAWNVTLVSLICLKRSLVFPILLFTSVFLHWSLRKAFLSLLAILWNSEFKWVYLSFSLDFCFLLFTAICKASSDSHFAFLKFFFLGMVLIPVSCTISWTSVHSSDRMWSTGERNGKPLQYSCLENPMNSMKRQKGHRKMNSPGR